MSSISGGNYRACDHPNDIDGNRYNVLEDECEGENTEEKVEENVLNQDIINMNESKATEVANCKKFVNCTYLSPEPLMTVKVKVADGKYNALIDTGSAKNLIQKSVIDNLEIPVKNSKLTIKCWLAVNI